MSVINLPLSEAEEDGMFSEQSIKLGLWKTMTTDAKGRNNDTKRAVELTDEHETV